MSALDEARIARVRHHMESENALDFDATMATFEHPRYELIGTGQVFDGLEDVMRYFRRSRTTFPDQHNEVIAVRAMDNAVLAEFWLIGTHLGPMPSANGPIAPTGKQFRVRMAAVFEFPPGGDKIVCERVYFDQASIQRQILG